MSAPGTPPVLATSPPTGTPAPPPGFARYQPPPGAVDEMVDASGEVRLHWQLVLGALQRNGPEGMARQDARIRRTLHGHGTTFQIHGEGDPTWGLDAVPVVITAAEWNGVRAGVAQRARLLDAVLADLYGPQRLLRDGLLPPDVVLRAESYLTQCVGVRPARDRYLLFHTADLGRGPDGAFQVLADRTEAPSGAGYALENREVLARIFPDLVRRAGVRRIVDWFEQVRGALADLAPDDVDDPRIVLFTGGPGSRTYFEQSFLARSLGYSLVEADDLTVRSGRVWLKSVGGLEPVHVIVRRVTGSGADPLELPPSSDGGVAGLIEATRRGTVAIANPIGSAAVGNPALLPFLPTLCRHLLGEDLRLPSVPTWWCGDDASRSHVLANLDTMVVKPIDRPEGRASRFGRFLDARGRDELVRRINADPHLWIAQDEIPLSTTPALAVPDGAPARLEPWLTILRTFSVNTGDGHEVMEGALSRSGAEPDHITIFEGGSSKDTWIVDASPQRTAAVPRRRVLPQIDLRASVTSRVAESMHWIGRNLERAEAAVRLVHAVDRYLEQWPELAEEADGTWVRIVEGAIVDLVGDTAPQLAPATTGRLLAGAIGDLSRPRSLATSLRFLLLGAQTVRELFSTDSWRLLTDLHGVASGLPDVHEDQVVEVASGAIVPLAALSGLLNESMVRDPGWRFLDAGRRIERASLVGGFLRSTMVEPVTGWIEAPMQEMVLSAWESLVAYRRRHRSDIEPAALLSLLVLDPSNPRSIRSAVDHLVTDLAALPLSTIAVAEEPAVDVALAARQRLREVDADELARVEDGRRGALDDLVGDVHDALDAVGAALSRQYFTHVRSTALVAHSALRAAGEPLRAGGFVDGQPGDAEARP